MGRGWQSAPTILSPDRDFDDREAALFAVEELAAPEDMLITAFDSESVLDRAMTERQQAASTGIEMV